jgi:hypothetical protein
MKEFTTEQKRTLRDKIVAMQETSGLSGNEFAVKRLGFTNGSKFSHVRNNWDKPGMVGVDTWEAIEKYIAKNEGYHGVVTENFRKVWDTCERAYALKKPMAIIGEGGLGKTYALDKYREHIEASRRFRVVFFNAEMITTQKQFVAGLMKAFDCYEPGTMGDQILKMQAEVKKTNVLLITDEVSNMEGHNVVIIKKIMSAFKDLCGIVFTGTPYFINNLNRGALRNRHLFSETRDRLFMLPETLSKPTADEAEAIFKANGITGERLDIVMGRNKKLISHSYLAKKTFRGIRDCIDTLDMLDIKGNYHNIQL